MGKKLIIANWKMNLGINEGSLFVHKLDTLVGAHPNVEIVIAPTMLALQPLHLQVQHHHFNLAAQNFYWRDSGAMSRLFCSKNWRKGNSREKRSSLVGY